MKYFDLFIYILYATQALLILNMIASLYYRIFRKKDVNIINKLQERKAIINYFFLVMVSFLIIMITNPFFSKTIEIHSGIKRVLFSASVTQLTFLLQKESRTI